MTSTRGGGDIGYFAATILETDSPSQKFFCKRSPDDNNDNNDNKNPQGFLPRGCLCLNQSVMNTTPLVYTYPLLITTIK